MLIKPTDATITALSRLARGAEWEALEAWLVASREALVDHSLSHDDVKCRQSQGALMAIDSLLKNTRASVELSARR